MNQAEVKQCIDVLNNGGVAVIPTDTVYGLVCRAADKTAVGRLYELKSREKKPGTIVATSVDQLVELGIKRRYLTAVAQYWPGAVSIEIPHDISYLNQNTGRQALRVANDKKLLQILDKTGPLLTSSANLPGEPNAKTIAEAMQYFGDKVDFYLDGGVKDSKPSTLIKIIDDAVEVVREGAVKISRSGEIENEL